MKIRKSFKAIALALSLIMITVFAGACKKNVQIPATGLTLNKTSISVVAGATETLSATITPADATNKNVTWQSENTSIATVDNDGKVKGVAEGTVIVKAISQYDTSIFDECFVTVTPAPISVQSVALDKNNMELIVGGGDMLKATVSPANATNKAVTWSSSAPAVVSVTNDGAVEGLKTGSATIKVMSVADNSKYAECLVTVVEGTLVAVESVTLNLNTAEVAEGGELTLTATVLPENASNKAVSWSSSDTLVATVVAGVVTAKTEGIVTIKVQSNSDNTKYAECVVTVTNAYMTNFYNNADFHDYGTLTNPTIEGQWEGYGIGDPFIMRYNGMYYLYVSTLDTENGVRAWKSPDLINWTKCTGEGLREGYVISDMDYTSRAAYAPEVFYFNGVFYMYTSPAGLGHYIYTATHPEGPFERQTANIQMSIDGSVLIDDDESMYFTRANDGGIRMHSMTDMLTIASGSATIGNSNNIGGWTEGSYILKRGDTYYLTYTGNHVASDAYRISYAYTTESDFTGSNSNKANSFKEGIDLPIVLNTDNPDLRGLGHSATVLGPDMDSYYMAYHNLNNSGGPNRSLNIDRLLFNGKQMSVEPTLYGAVAPKLPAFRAEDTTDSAKFTVASGKAISTLESDSVFTAEFNFSDTSAITLAVNYKDANNFDSIEVDLMAKTIKLFSTVGGVKTLKGSGTMKNAFDENVLHTVRYAQRADGKADVYFDNMRKIKDVAHTGNGGKIGYIYEGEPVIGYTAFSNVAGGLSDKQEVKQATGTIGASLYSPDAGMSKITGNGGVSTVMSGTYENADMLKLGATGDYATYLVTFAESGYWGMDMIYPKTSAGKRIRISIDKSNDSEALIFTLSDNAQAGATAIKSYIETIAVWSGISQVKIESLDGEVGFISFTFFKSTRVSAQYSHNLNSYMERGSDYRTIWKLAGADGADGHRAISGTRQLVFIGDSTITDFTLEIDIKLVGGTSTNSAGIVFRAGNYAASQHDNHSSIQGYYLGLNNAGTTLQRMNYGETNPTFAISAVNNASDTWIHVKIVARGGNYKIYLNNAIAPAIEANDALSFTHGRLGLYTDGAEACYKNLSITP